MRKSGGSKQGRLDSASQPPPVLSAVAVSSDGACAKSARYTGEPGPASGMPQFPRKFLPLAALPLCRSSDLLPAFLFLKSRHCP